uniref:protein-serine/threonine phosphatase n=1 Tax=Kalanchoe fedtschenkoi TaxID=63787 RepID=A0A7N0UGS7_KALFE
MTCGVAVANSPSFSQTRVASPFGKSSPPPRSCSSLSFPSSPLSLRLRNSSRSPFRENEKEVCDSGALPVLKRKRPPRIDIPVESLSFAAVAPRQEEDRLDEVVEEGDGYAVYCKRGRRSHMEDRFSAVVEDCGKSKQAYFGVFDGHGGSKAAEFAANNLRKNILAAAEGRGEDEIEAAVKDGYITTDVEFLKEDVSGGACCVTAIIRNGDLVVSNAGDCRAVMSRGRTAEALTSDHKPSREDERSRIESLGGYVDLCRGIWRIQGSLAVSRGIGDGSLKQWVLSEPETRVLKIKPDCEFLILASDGLWDKVDNQEAVDTVYELIAGVDKPDLTSSCKKLVELSTSRGSQDDTSVMIIQLGSFAA